MCEDQGEEGSKPDGQDSTCKGPEVNEFFCPSRWDGPAFQLVSAPHSPLCTKGREFFSNPTASA